MLTDEITAAQLLVKTDAYQMSIGEIVSMYDEQELVIDPEFQRLFRWDASQKSRLIESLLLGIPIPSIFVFEQENGKWELIDGLQRISTILEFMGRLRKSDGSLRAPSILEATKYLPSLYNVVWEKSELIGDVEMDSQNALDKSFQLAIRRARIGVEILKRPSNNRTKFDLFQRLNAGGTQANAQELRNCIVIMINSNFYRVLKTLAGQSTFQTLFNISEDQLEKQKHMELATRFVVHALVDYDGRLDVEEYIDEGIVELANSGDMVDISEKFNKTFELLNRALGANALRRHNDGQYSGRVGLVALEAISVGIAKNLPAILALAHPEEFIQERIRSFWESEQIDEFTSPGKRGTTRIQKTVPFGESWFKP